MEGLAEVYRAYLDAAAAAEAEGDEPPELYRSGEPEAPDPRGPNHLRMWPKDQPGHHGVSLGNVGHRFSRDR